MIYNDLKIINKKYAIKKLDMFKWYKSLNKFLENINQN